MRSVLVLVLMMAACGGDEKKAEPAAPAPPPAPAAPVEAPKPPPAAAPVSTGPYTPDDLAKAAYEKARAAGADAKTNPKSGDAAAIAAGKTQFDMVCASCHGATGMGDGVAGAGLPQKPANFTWKERWDTSSVGVKHWIVQNGIAGTGMAGFVPDEAKAWELISYVETLGPKAGAAAPATTDAAPPATGAEKDKAPAAVGGDKGPAAVGGVKPDKGVAVGGTKAEPAKDGKDGKDGKGGKDGKDGKGK